MKNKERLYVGLALGLWLVLNLAFLTRYPLMHSDEAWLAGLSRSMLANGDIGVTESFFDLKPRWPHAIKLLFQVALMPFLRAFGHTLFAIRLPSLLVGVAALWLAYRVARTRLSFGASMGVAGLFAFNEQFIAIAHTARQEIYLLALLLGCLYLLCAHAPSIKRGAMLGVLTGLSAGLHPNGFLLACGVGCSLVVEMLLAKRFRWRELACYLGVTAGLAVCFVGISFSLDPMFPTHYRMYGQNEFSLFEPSGSPLREFGLYISKLFTGSSVTYHVPELRLSMILGGLCCLLSGALAVWQRKDSCFFALPVGVLAGTAFIGRYNQLSAALWLLPMLLSLVPLIAARPKAARALPAVLAAWLALSGAAVARTAPHSYEAYVEKIAAHVPPSERTLGNLNTALYFDEDAFLDVRNLSYLKESNMSFAEYVQSNDVRYILWSDEMAFIYEQRPTWNILYGNPRYVPEAERFFAESCEKVAEITDSAFAARIVSEFGTPHTLTIYRVLPHTP